MQEQVKSVNSDCDRDVGQVCDQRSLSPKGLNALPITLLGHPSVGTCHPGLHERESGRIVMFLSAAVQPGS